MIAAGPRSVLTRAVATLATLAAGLWLTAAQPAGACACGLAIEATVSEESGLVIEAPGHEQIVLSLDLTSDGGERAAVVLPVPGDPEVAAIEKGDPLTYLDRATAPAAQVGAAPGAGGGEDTAAAPVDVIGRETIGGYDVSRLAAGDPRALAEWLDRNGYALPSGAEPILSDYVDEGWRFVAIRLAPASEGRLKPLRVSFDADAPVYPMRLAQLGTAPVNLTLYALADSERRVDGLETVWTGGVDELDPPPPPDLAELFAQGTEVTRMEATGIDPARFTDDLVIEPVPSAVPGPDSTAAAPAPDDEGPEGVVVTLVFVAVLALLGFGVATIVRRRGSG